MSAEPPATPPTEPSPTRRHRRSARSDRRRAIVAFSLAGTMAVGLALVATDVVRTGSPSRLLAAVAPIPTTSTTAIPVPRTERPCRPLTVDKPLRVWIAGDSLTGTLGPALGDMLGGTGVVQANFESRVSSGLGNPSFFDWPARTATELPRLTPELVVFEIGTNDWAVPLNGTLDASGGPAWKATYAQKVQQMLDLLTASGRPVLWVGAPVLRDTKMNEGIKALNEVTRDVVARTPQATYIDAYAIFTDADGKYADRLPDENGRLTTVRHTDGVHLTAEGGTRLARAAFNVIDAACDVNGQAVANAVKRTIETQGSTRRDGTVATEAPATSSPPASSSPTTSSSSTTTTSTTTPGGSTTTTSTTTPGGSTTTTTTTTTTTPTKPPG